MIQPGSFWVISFTHMEVKMLFQMSDFSFYKMFLGLTTLSVPFMSNIHKIYFLFWNYQNNS